MADASDEHTKRLKELEADLAKELEQQVNLSGPSDSRLEGKVAVNPELDSSTKVKPRSETVTQTPEPETEDEDDDGGQSVDDLLNAVDGDFASRLNKIQDDLGKVKDIPNFESIGGGAEIIDNKENSETLPGLEVLKADDPLELGNLPFFSSLVRLITDSFKVPLEISIALVSNGIRLARKEGKPAEIMGDLLDEVFDSIKVIKKDILGSIDALKQYSLSTIIKFFLLCFLAVFLLFLLKDMVSKLLISDNEKDPFLRSLKEVASKEIEFSADGDMASIDNPYRHPEYTVLLEQMTGNLKSLGINSQPMGSIQLYVESSNRDCAIELSERKIEVRDAILRILEETQFDELDTPQGKNKFKLKVQIRLNKFLNKGRVKRIFFKSLNLGK